MVATTTPCHVPAASHKPSQVTVDASNESSQVTAVELPEVAVTAAEPPEVSVFPRLWRCVYQTVKKHNPNFTFLQCTSAYPLPLEHVNLSLIPELQKEFPDIPIGYSGHETGIHVSVAAVALGAKVLERHVTLDKSWKGSDHAASLEPAELAELVKAIRTVEMAMGSPIKQMLPCEASCHSKLGKSVVARKPLQKGEMLTLDMLTVKVAEPHGVRPENIFKLVGKKIPVDLEKDATITDAMIKG
ncbi:N-acetylneuraminic acid synthase b [Onychostoma macrolepis]|uniref:N-acetylneuraminic acid synthase b n=1 Tax=Onychostoma macrolepis TaxID=369639 RepID=UPI00272D82E3|nr:N-acetylneuraminic acid synthase b [Onychostoma macrolepis]